MILLISYSYMAIKASNLISDVELQDSNVNHFKVKFVVCGFSSPVSHGMLNYICQVGMTWCWIVSSETACQWAADLVSCWWYDLPCDNMWDVLSEIFCVLSPYSLTHSHSYSPFPILLHLQICWIFICDRTWVVSSGAFCILSPYSSMVISLFL